MTNDERLARSLGWFSVGLGMAEVLAPRGVARLAGMPPWTIVLRAFGLREIASGVQILTGGRRSVGGLWSRVAGDAIDLALLTLAFASPRARRGRLTAATAAVAGITALDMATAERLSHAAGADGLGVIESLAINRPPGEVYQLWRDFRNLPRFMRHLDAVHLTGDRQSHWVARGPGGMTVEWDAEITEERPNDMIAWRSLPGSPIHTAGRVRFQQAPGGRGTLVRVEMDYRPPAGALGAAVARIFGREPEQQLKEDLRRLKQILEVGEIVSNEGPSARRSA